MNHHLQRVGDQSLEYRSYPKLHINPHFNQTKATHSVPHINPNFYRKLYSEQQSEALAGTAPKIHVNPKFVNVSKLHKSIGSSSQGLSESRTEASQVATLHRPLPTTTISSVPAPSTQHLKSKYKLVNVKTDRVNVKQKAPSTSRTNFTSTKHHNDTSALAVPLVSMSSSPSKYSLVQQNTIQSATSTLRKNTVRISRYKIVPTTYRNNNMKTSVIPASQWNESKNGTNRKIDRRLKVAHKYKQIVLGSKKCNTFNKSFTNLITIKGRKFSLTDKSLKLIGPTCDTPRPNSSGKLTVRVNGRTYIQKSRHLFVRKSLGAKDKESFKKNNIPCPLFHKFGKCVKKEKGKCPLLHDKRHIVICRKFLKGLCQDEHCLLSHQVTAEKMPTCSFYLQGCCTRENCPYLHVKVNDSAVICVDFLNGFCELGDRCAKRHIYLCPEYAKSGKCTRSKCSYPHNNREYKISHAVRPSKMTDVNISRVEKVETSQKLNNKLKIETRRYYVRGDSAEGSSENASDEIHTTRCRLGALPSFIKL